MRDRFMPLQVWEHFDFDIDQCKKQFLASPDMAAFRSLMFSKVVPNLRKLGLLTPRVREGFEQLGILRYERYIDSATEAGELEADEGDLTDPISVLRASLGNVDKIAPEPVLMVLASMADPSRLAEVNEARIRLNITGVDAGDWIIRVAPDGVAYQPSTPEDQPDATATMPVETWTDIISGRVTAPAAVINGNVTIEGDVMKALALEALL